MTASTPPLLQQPQKAPLPCYGLEFNDNDPRCQECPHQQTCTQAMGRRLNRVPLSKAHFQLVPVTYNLVYEQIDFEDPEIANLPRLYLECHWTIFNKEPKDRIIDRDAVAQAARRLNTSIRLYILTVMSGHRAQQADVTLNTEKAKMSPFKAKLLTSGLAVRWYENFRDITVKKFGHFSLASISTLLNQNFDKNSPEYRMVTSETRAAQCIINFKMGTGGPFYEHLYSECELSLDPLWLAIEPSYKTSVLDKYRDCPSGSRMERDHRHEVSQTVGYLKKHEDTAIMAFQAREAVMQRAVRDALTPLGYTAEDFMVEATPITDCLNFWNWIALAVQHDHCLRFVDGERSMLFSS